MSKIRSRSRSRSRSRTKKTGSGSSQKGRLRAALATMALKMRIRIRMQPKQLKKITLCRVFFICKKNIKDYSTGRKKWILFQYMYFKKLNKLYKFLYRYWIGNYRINLQCFKDQFPLIFQFLFEFFSLLVPDRKWMRIRIHRYNKELQIDF